MRWLRLYDDTINDPKILKLPEAMRWHWIAMLCVASKNEGNLPHLDDIAIQLRVTAAKATEILTALVKAGLLDKLETGFTPHNWNGRQYKSDVSTDRVKRFRNGKRNVSETPSETETETDAEDRIGPRGGIFTEGSKALATALWRAFGFESPLQIPPELAGADWRAIGWEKAGWTADLIEAESKRIGPDKPLVYYEKVFATAFAKRHAPLPVVAIREAEKLSVTHGTSQNKPGLIAAIDRKLAALEAEAGADFAMPENSILRISG